MSASAEWHARFLRLKPKGRELLLGLQRTGAMENISQHVDHRALEQLSDFDETSQLDIISNFVTAVQERPLRNPSAYLCSLITTRRRNNSNNTVERARMPPETLKRVHDLLRRHLAEDLATINIETVDMQCKVALAQMPEEMAVKCLSEFRNRPSGVYLRNPSAYLMSTIRRVTSSPAPIPAAEVEEAARIASQGPQALTHTASGKAAASQSASSASSQEAESSPQLAEALLGVAQPQGTGPSSSLDTSPASGKASGPAALPVPASGALLPGMGGASNNNSTEGAVTGGNYAAAALSTSTVPSRAPSAAPFLEGALSGQHTPRTDGSSSSAAPAPLNPEGRSQRDLELELACRKVQELTLQNEMLRASLAAQGRLPLELQGPAPLSAPASILASSVQSPQAPQQHPQAALQGQAARLAASGAALRASAPLNHGAIGSRPQSAALASHHAAFPSALYGQAGASSGPFDAQGYPMRGSAPPAPLMAHHAHGHAAHHSAAFPEPHLQDYAAHFALGTAAQGGADPAALWNPAAAVSQGATYSPFGVPHHPLAAGNGAASNRSSEPLSRYYSGQRGVALELEGAEGAGAAAALGLGLSVNPLGADSLLAQGPGLHFASLLEQGR